MVDSLQLAPGDRVLLLSIPDPRVVAEICERVEYGPVVALGPAEDVAEARRMMRELENVLFVPAGLEEIPWQDGFFNRVLEARGGWEATPRTCREIMRVMAAGGRAVFFNVNIQPLVEAGLKLTGEGAGYAVLAS